MKKWAHRPLFSIFLYASLAALVIISAGLGYLKLTPEDCLRLLYVKASGGTINLDKTQEIALAVLWDVRLPRVLTAAAVGGALAMCGVVFQAILQNPLADPYTLGVSSGAAFGASLAIILNLTWLPHVSVPVFAFVGAVFALMAVINIASFQGQSSANTMILSGVIVGAILSAGISFMKYVAGEHVSTIIFWLMGGFSSCVWLHFFTVLIVTLTASVVFVYYARQLDIMSLGHRISETLGVDSNRVRVVMLVVASILTAACVSVSGIIGFIGLVVPHLMRIIAGPVNSRLLLLAYPAGAILLLAADTTSRTAFSTDVPVGILTALIGGPFFCVIFRKRLKGSDNV